MTFSACGRWMVSDIVADVAAVAWVEDDAVTWQQWVECSG